MSNTTTIMFVDDDPTAGKLLRRFCESTDYEYQGFRDPREALTHFQKQGADVIISDLRMPEMSGLELLQHIRQQDQEVPFIVITAHSTLESAIEALRLGATDFLKKPFDMDELLLLVGKTLEHSRLKRENILLRRQLKREQSDFGMIGASPVIQQLQATIEKIADIPCNVIIQGESGTGKELVARAIHNLGSKAGRPLVTVDCGALNETLLESELFGHEKGAFTGANQARPGLLVTASGGTVFLDEIGNISDAMQIKLLRAIQEQQVTRVGSVRPVDIDVRFLVASNQDLETLVGEGKFRADLYHRLNVIKLFVPPLRERSEDIPLLTQYFVEHFAEKYQRDISGFDAASKAWLLKQSWPGNIRELCNLIERHVVLASEPELVIDTSNDTRTGDAQVTEDEPTLAELERRYILKVLDKSGGNRQQAASILGIDKSTLWRRLQQYNQE